MPTPPTGTVTFLFTDLEGSTKLWETHADTMKRAVAHHDALMRAAIEANRGYVFKTVGDAFCAAFPTALDGLTAALAAQRALVAEAWNSTPLKARMALHSGNVEERDGDYFGRPVNRVARLLSAGYGGQILVSLATAELLRDHLPAGLTLRDLGEERLKDLERPEHIYQLVAPDLPTDFPPLKTLGAVANEEDSPAPGEPPFKGLQYFDVADANNFFGREALTAKLVERLREFRFLAVVVGASGSGKSSLVRAGLVPALTNSSNPRYAIHILTPTAHPLEALAHSLTRDSDSASATTTLMDDLAREARTLHVVVRKILDRIHGSRLLLVVDQFEEVFTLCRSENERRAFIDNLIHATSPEVAGPTTVVITLRADFYAHCAAYANLREALASRQEYIGPMNEEELRRAIEEPAKRGSWSFEPGLVDTLLKDVGDEPGALPLLSHALLETWQRRRGRVMTFAGYNAAGGVRGAIAKTAESVYTSFSSEQQAIARNIFMRLTELGEGTQDTRRRASLTELVPPFADARAADAVLNALADARLITTSEGYAEVAHEALIREWQTLREWLNQNREGLRLHRHLTEGAQSWDALKRDPGELYRGARLAQAAEWAKTNASELNPLEKEFLDASQDLLAREEAEREAQRQRELIAAQKLAEEQQRRANILRWATIGSTILLVVMIGLAVFATSQRLEAVTQRDAAQKAQADAENARQVAFVRELSVSSVANLDIDPERSILLAMQAVSLSAAGGKLVLREAEEALHRAITTSRVQTTLRGHTNTVNYVTYSPDGTRVATMGFSDGVKIWDSATGKELLFLSTHALTTLSSAIAISYSPDGKLLATQYGENQIRIWDATTGQPLQTFSGHTSPPIPVHFSPDGKRLVSGGGDGTIKVWGVSTGQEVLKIAGHKELVLSVKFSADGKRLATGSSDRTAKIWDASTGELLFTLTGHGDTVYQVSFTPDGTRLITTSADTTTRIWDIATGRTLLTLFGHVSIVGGLAIDSKGTRIITGSEDGTAKVWDVVTGQNLLTLNGHTSGVLGVAISPDGTRVITGSRDKTARVWDISGTGGREWANLIGHTDLAVDIAYSHDGKRLATAGYDKMVKIWDAETGKELQTITNASPVQAVIFSPDGSRLMIKDGDGIVRVWDVSNGKELLKITTEQITGVGQIAVIGLAFSPDGKRLATGAGTNKAKIWNIQTGEELMTFTGHALPVFQLAFSQDGTRLATVSGDSTAKVWDAVTGKEITTFTGHPGRVNGVKFSPDGKYVATTSNDGTARIWDANTGKEIQVLSGHTGTVFGVAFSPDGKRLASTSVDKTIKIWDVSQIAGEVKEPLTLYGHSAAVFRVAWSPDGTRLATASRDRTAHVWAMKLEDLLAIAKSRVTRTLTQDECQKYLHVEACP